MRGEKLMPGHDKFNRNIIATVTKCVTPDCRGWLTDAFAGKYLIRCMDSKHNTTSNDMPPAKEIVGDLGQSDSLRQNPNKAVGNGIVIKKKD